MPKKLIRRGAVSAPVQLDRLQTFLDLILAQETIYKVNIKSLGVGKNEIYMGGVSNLHRS